MSALVEINRVNGAFSHMQDAESAPRHHGADIPLLGPDQWSGQQDAGLRLAGDAEPEARFASAPLIAIDFPAFHDGRGLSLAVMLRTRIGYRGELRAVGDIRPDLLHYLKRCGFDSFVLPDGISFDLDDPRLAPHASYYQASVVDPEPVFRRGQRSV